MPLFLKVNTLTSHIILFDYIYFLFYTLISYLTVFNYKSIFFLGGVFPIYFCYVGKGKFGLDHIFALSLSLINKESFRRIINTKLN